MRIFIASPLQAGQITERFRPEDYLVSIVCVLRVKLVVNGVCIPLNDKDQPGLQKSETYDDGKGSSLRFGGDFAPYKPRTDVTLVGHAHVPGGQKAIFLPVIFGVNGWRKSLDVIGDRDLVRDERVSFTTPQAFSAMPLRMEKAFGGLKSPYNPWGKGYGILGTQSGSKLSACNIHPAGHRHFDWSAKIAADGYGPLPSSHLPRSKLRGTHNEAWLYQRSPLPPEDFDWGYYNVAPSDQQFFPYLRGDETLHFRHLHEVYPYYTSELPGLRLRILIRRELPEGETFQIEELSAPLDSVHIDADAMTVDLGWRAVTRSLSKNGDDIRYGYVASELLTEEPRPLSEHIAAFQAQIDPPRIKPEPPPSEPPPSEEEASDSELEQVETLKMAIERMPFKAPFKDAVADAKTSAEIKQLIEVEGKRVLEVLQKAAKVKPA